MFITNDANRSSIGQIISSPAETYWTAIELALSRIWFVITFIQADVLGGGKKCSIKRTMFLSSIEDIEGIVDLCGKPGFEIDAAYIVSPGYTNGSSDWNFERMVAVWSAYDKSVPGETVSIFETESGARYTDGLHETPIANFRDVRLRIALPCRTVE